jgi:hypothetical protein
MKYLCLIYTDEAAFGKMTKAEADTMIASYMAFSDDIRKTGHYLGGNRLHTVNAATTLRVRNGKMSTTDGPFAETKEQLGGYYLVEAKDLNEAIQIASRIPGATMGSIEVRPVADSHMSMTDNK